MNSEGAIGLTSSQLDTGFQYYSITKIASNNLVELANNLGDSMDIFFTEEELDQLALDTGFVRRKGKINGSLFLALVVFNSENLKEQSLNDLSIILKDRNGIDITKQSLHDRFNENALFFLKDALEKLMGKQFSVEQTLLANCNTFGRILIKDSTCFQIDESLAEYYPGSGGSGSKASVRIQFEYDILSGEINDLTLNAFNDQDAKDSVATIELTKEGDLIIRDLAYMNIKALQLIVESMAFFLCRANPNTYIYEIEEDEYKKIDFVKITAFMKRNSLGSMEKTVYLGNKEKFRVRLIIYLIPEEEAAKRLRNAVQNNKKKGGDGNLSKEYKARAFLNLFITNANEEQIPIDHVWQLYRLRWQIELIFKIWKSICDIEKVKKVKKHRLECYIISKLILIVLGWKVMWSVAKQLFIREGKVLSFFKASKTLLRTKIGELCDVLLRRKLSLADFMNTFYEISRSNHLLEKKKDEPTSMELLLSFITLR